MYVNKAGALWGALPAVFGQVFWVSPSSTYIIDGVTYSASDGNDGISPERALRTIANAWTRVHANVGDIIVLLPGAHSVSSAISASVSGVSMIGVPGQNRLGTVRPTATLTSTGANALITIPAGTTNLEFAWIHFIGVTAQDAITVGTTTVVGLHIHHCSFDMFTATPSLSTVGVNAQTSTGSAFHFHHNWIKVTCSGTSQGPAVLARFARMIIENNIVQLTTQTWAVGMQVGAANGIYIIRDNQMISGNTGAVTKFISATTGGANGAALITRNIFTASSTPVVDDYGANVGNIALNFKTDPGAAAGGTQVAAIT